MKMMRWISIASLAATTAVAACAGWGSSPDPSAAAASATLTSILKLPSGFVLDHVGHVVTDSSRVFASISGTVGGMPTHALVRLAEGAAADTATAEADSVGVSGSRADPRLWVDGSTLYWVRNRDKASACALEVYSAQSGAKPASTVPLSTSWDCSPIGLASGGGSVFVVLASSYCGFDFTGNNAGLSMCSSDLVRVTGSTATTTSFDTGLSSTLPNVILSDGQWLYWFTTSSALTADGGFTTAKQLVKQSLQADDAGVTPQPMQVAILDDSEVPVAWVLQGSDIYAALVTQRVTGMSVSASGCRILRIPTKGGSPVALVEDKMFTCGGIATDGTRGYVQGATVQEPQWALGGFALTAGASLGLFPLERDGLVLMSTHVSGKRVIVSGPQYILSLPKDAL